MAQISIIQKADISEAGRFDAEYFKPEYLEVDKKLNSINCKILNKYCNFCKKGIFDISPKYYKSKGVPLIRTSEIKHPFINFSTTVFLDEEVHNLYKNTELQTGDLIFTKIGAYIGDVSILPPLYKKYNFSQNVAGLSIKKDKINPYFLLAFLLSKYSKNQILRITMLSGQGKLELKDIKNLKIPTLCKNIQSEIEKTVKESYQKQSQAKQLYQEAEALLLEELGLVDYQPQHQLTFDALKSEVEEIERFDSEYFQPKALKLRQLFESENSIKVKDVVIHPITSGSTPKSGGDGYLKNGEVKFIRAVNLNNLEIHCENVLFIKDEIHNKMLKRSQLQTNDVVFSIAGVIGRCAVVDNNIGQANINQALAIIRLNQKIFNPYYVALFFNSKHGNQYVNDISRPVAQTNLNLTELSNIHIPLLSIEIQSKIAEKITQSHILRKQSKELLELAKLKVEQEIERN